MNTPKDYKQAARLYFIGTLKNHAEALRNVVNQHRIAPLSKDDLARAVAQVHRLSLSASGFGLGNIAVAGMDVERLLERSRAEMPPSSRLDEKSFKAIEIGLAALQTLCLDIFKTETGLTETAKAQPGGVQDVLIVDDDREVAGLLSLNLERAGVRVAVAADGEAALKRIARQRPDLVILDISLPGMSGHDVLRRLKQDPNFVDLPILMLTARSDRSEVISALSLGAADYVVKPVAPEAIHAKVEKILRAPPKTGTPLTLAI